MKREQLLRVKQFYVCVHCGSTAVRKQRNGRFICRRCGKAMKEPIKFVRVSSLKLRKLTKKERKQPSIE